MLGSRARGVALAVLAGLLPWFSWLCTASSRTPPEAPDFADYLVAGAAWLVLGCSCWLAAMVVAVLLETLGAGGSLIAPLGFLNQSCPQFVRRFILLWCGLAVTSVLVAPANARSTTPQPAPLPTIGRVLDQPASKPPEQHARPRSIPADLVRIRKGDSLWAIAQQHLGDGTRWPEIYQLNRHLIRDPDQIEIGWELKLPTRTTTKGNR